MIIGSDAKGLISKLQSRQKGRAHVDQLIDDMRSFLPCFRFPYASHVKRGGINVGHLMAGLSPDEGRCNLFGSIIPCSVLTLVILGLIHQ